MIDYTEWSVFGVIFSWKGTTLSRTWVNVVAAFIIAFITNVVCEYTSIGYPSDIDLSATKYPLIFVAVLLVFRCGFAYARFMEGRGHVGKMVLTVRDLARMMCTFVVDPDPTTERDKANIVRLLKAFVISNRLSCRKEEATGFAELEAHLTSSEALRLRELKKNHPLTILQWIGQVLANFKQKQLFARALDAMEEQVGTLMEAWMGMQKLATTPFPFPYAQLCTYFLFLWCYSFPFAAAFTLQWFGIPVAGVISFALFGINTIALELEDPFGEETNDIDLNFFEGACMSACKALLPAPLKPEEVEWKAEAIKVEFNAPAAQPYPAAIPAASPVAASATSVAAITQSPDFRSKAYQQLKTAHNYEGLSPEMQIVFKECHAEFTFESGGKIGQAELLKLVVKLSLMFQLNNGLPHILSQVETADASARWDAPTFANWYLAVVKSAL